MKRRLKINGIIMFCGFVLIAVSPIIFLRKEKEPYFAIDQLAEIFGIAFIFMGQILRASARGFKSEHSQNGHSLVEGGPYALMRNPMYLGIILISLGVILMLFEWWVALIFFLFFVIRYHMLIFKEEKKLLEAFPKEYLDYKQSVPRILPSLTKIAKEDISEYLPLKLSWVKKEIGTILTVLFLALFVESWEDIKKKGMAIYFKEATAYLVIIILFICLTFYLTRRNAGIENNASGKSQDNL